MSKALSRLTRQGKDLSDLILSANYQVMADRAAAILVASDLDNALERTILTRMISLNRTQYEELFVNNAPLASFSAKIRMAHALGIIGKQVRIDLDCIRPIRNAFAHARKAIHFDTPEVAEACKRLTVDRRRVAHEPQQTVATYRA
jgi:DNA-binding MltR family transcriptional regulator